MVFESFLMCDINIYIYNLTVEARSWCHPATSESSHRHHYAKPRWTDGSIMFFHHAFLDGEMHKPFHLVWA